MYWSPDLSNQAGMRAGNYRETTKKSRIYWGKAMSIFGQCDRHGSDRIHQIGGDRAFDLFRLELFAGIPPLREPTRSQERTRRKGIGSLRSG